MKNSVPALLYYGYTNFGRIHDPTPQEFKTKDWVYKYSLQMFQNGLTGNCYGIASSVAAIAKELGYEPMLLQFRMDTALL